MLLPYTLVFRLYGLLHPGIYPLENTTILYRFLFGQLHGNPLVEQILGILIVFIQAVWINRTVIRHRLSREITLFPGLFYIILVSLSPSLLGLNPSLITNFIFIIVLDDILSIYLKKEVAKELFNYGFGLGLAVLIYPPYFPLLCSAIAGIAIMRNITLRQILQWLGGVLSVFFLSSLCFSFFGPWDALIKEIFHLNPEIVTFWKIQDWRSWVYLFLILFALIVLLLNTNLINRGIAYKERKKWKVLYWILFFAILSLFFTRARPWEVSNIIAIPLSMALGSIAANTRNTIVVEIAHLIILIGILFMQYNG